MDGWCCGVSLGIGTLPCKSHNSLRIETKRESYRFSPVCILSTVNNVETHQICRKRISTLSPQLHQHDHLWQPFTSNRLIRWHFINLSTILYRQIRIKCFLIFVSVCHATAYGACVPVHRCHTHSKIYYVLDIRISYTCNAIPHRLGWHRSKTVYRLVDMLSLPHDKNTKVSRCKCANLHDNKTHLLFSYTKL